MFFFWKVYASLGQEGTEHTLVETEPNYTEKEHRKILTV